MGRRFGFSSMVMAVLAFIPLLASVSAPDVASAQTPVAQESDATYDEGPCPFSLSDDLVEGEGITCGVLDVPEFHAEPAGRRFELAVAVIPSTSSRPAEIPLVLLLGGPGQEVASALLLFSEGSPINYRPLLERQDVILLEQRGIGYSEPSLACPFDAVGGADPEIGAEEIEDAPAAFADCVEGLRDDGIDLEAFDTKENAADVNDLRAALGYDQVDLFGISYGSKLALTVMRDFPEAVRSAVLASPAPLQADLLAGRTVAFDRALERLFDACAADEDCSEAHPDLDEAFGVAVERLDKAPVELTVNDPLSGEEIDLTIDGQAFIEIVYLSTFVGLLLPFVPGIIDAAANGDTGPLEFVAPFSAALSEGVSFGANFVYNCNDEFAFTDAAEVQELIEEADVRPELAEGGLSDLEEAFEVCEVIDVDPAARSENSAVESDVPTLIVAGEYDPITPPSYAEEAAETLPNSFVVVLPGLGHDPITTGGACGLGIVQDFLADPTEEPDTGCVDRMSLDFLI